MVIVDTSVAFKWFINEEYMQQAKAILEQHIAKIEEIVIPDLLLYEITNAWSTKSTLLAEEIEDNLVQFEALGLTIISGSFALLKQASSFSKKHRVSTYDAVYAVLAKENRCCLITADNKFSDQVKLPFVKNLSDFPLSNPII